MQNAETALEVIRNRGERRLPVERAYRLLFNKELYLRAYAKLYSNEGALTRGVTAETADGMSLDKIDGIIEAIRQERHRWKPVRRVEIPKSNGKTRPLGLPTWTDKLMQEVMRSIMEAYYEPRFSHFSHGFRPGRGCHTALRQIQRVWTGTKWFIEGDIKGCFDNVDHDVLLGILGDNIHDGRFLKLVKGLLDAGYMEDWRYAPTPSGTPQGGVISPILSNIYLDRLDRYMEEVLLPEYNRGKKRRPNPEYARLTHLAGKMRQKGDLAEARRLDKERTSIPVGDPDDPNYRRLWYCRYADDFLLGFIGPKHEALEIKERIRKFLGEQLKLELSETKTLVTHAATEAAKFLGYEITAQSADARRDRHGRRAVNGTICLRIPVKTVRAICDRYMEGIKAVSRQRLLDSSDFSIVSKYQSEYRGYVQYYKLAKNLFWLNKVQWVMSSSLLKTLAKKHNTQVAQMAAKLRSTVQTPNGPRACLKVSIEREGKEPLVTYFGGLSLKHNPNVPVGQLALTTQLAPRNELIKRLLADTCELCGANESVQVHQVRHLADLYKGRRDRPFWVQVMATRKRKTLVVCRDCHSDIESGAAKRPRTESRRRAV